MYYLTGSIILSLKLINIKNAITDGCILYKNIFKNWKILNKKREREKDISFAIYTHKDYIETFKYL